MFEIGNTLREARLRRGLDILDCEAETKIRAKYLRAMEEEQFDLMPSPPTVRGFLKSYAEFLDLDGQLVLDEYESRFGDYEARYEPPDRTPPRRRRRGTRGQQPPRRPGPSQRRNRRRRRSELQLRGWRSAASWRSRCWSGSEWGRATRPRPSRTSRGRARRGRDARGPVEPDTASQEAPVRVKKIPIVLTGTGSIGSWVQVRGGDADGRVVYDGDPRPRPGQGLQGGGGDLRAANPGELTVTVNGREVELDASTTANFEITREGAELVE